MKATLIKVGRCLLLLALVSAGLIYSLGPFPTAMELGQNAKVKADLSAISQCLMAYENLIGFLPSTSQGLEALTAKPSVEPIPKHW